MSKVLNKDIWLVLGAGISRAAPSNIPLWSEMKNATIVAILERLIGINSQQWHNLPDAFQFEQTSADLRNSISMPEVVMQCLCNVYLEQSVKNQLISIISPTSK